MNTKSIFLALCCLTAFSSYAQHVPTLEEVVNGGLIVTKGESRVNWLSEGNRRSDCHEGRKPGKLAFRGEQLFKKREKSGWGIRYRFVYAR